MSVFVVMVMRTSNALLIPVFYGGGITNRISEPEQIMRANTIQNKRQPILKNRLA